jgi:hypothetical protein
MDETRITYRKMKNAYQILDAKPQAKELHGRLRHKCDDDIKIDLKRNRLRENGLE